MENRILEMFSDFLRWTERELRFQLMAPLLCCLEFRLTPPTPAPAVGGTYFCGSEPLDSQGRRGPAGNGPGEEVVIITIFKNLCFNLHAKILIF